MKERRKYANSFYRATVGTGKSAKICTSRFANTSSEATVRSGNRARIYTKSKRTQKTIKFANFSKTAIASTATNATSCILRSLSCKYATILSARASTVRSASSHNLSQSHRSKCRQSLPASQLLELSPKAR